MPVTLDARPTVDTVLGPIPAADLGVVAVHESLLSVLPGAQYAYDISMDRAEILAAIAGQLRDFRSHGGGTIVDSTGMFHGRDLPLYEALSRATGVHIVASTGLGPEALLGGYFLTPQTNPPTPWPAEKFADLFAAEVTDGMVVPRVERRAPAGLVTTSTTASGTTATDASMVRGAARAAVTTGVPMSLRSGGDILADLALVREEALPAERVVVGGLDRSGAAAAGLPLAIAMQGYYVAIDHVGTEGGAYLTDEERAQLVVELLTAGHGDRVLLSSSAIGVAVGVPSHDVGYSRVLTDFVPLLRSRGVDEASIDRILIGNPSDLLTRK